MPTGAAYCNIPGMDDKATRDHAGPAEELEIERFIPYRMAVLADWMSRSLAGTYQARFGISIPEWRVLAHLAREEPLSAGVLSERTNMDKPRVSRALQRMARSALIERESDAHDQRVAVIRMSAHGRATYERIAPLARAWERELLAGLDESECLELQRLLDRLQEQVARMRDRP
ncbi:MarR family winged helix-turn-helix transcriptional regulator [Arhodomonas aquaeolei]|uniref:MarR family winged helix-turn-helix transcriptional regulator n=1 Tax=Arhodomonas aquaeolei TaxID=2369 RepID=UPI000369BF8A|nr:MarR family winged helix-turn-helix transcriptional regulator [Arhodomonas aquaeolei]